jgi:hypothetical protein
MAKASKSLLEPASDEARVPAPGGSGAAKNGDGARNLLSQYSRDELMQLLTPERKPLYERIRGLREAIGELPIDVIESLRELRENA